jgi:hypothetical protein
VRPRDLQDSADQFKERFAPIQPSVQRGGDTDACRDRVQIPARFKASALVECGEAIDQEHVEAVRDVIRRRASDLELPDRSRCGGKALGQLNQTQQASSRERRTSEFRSRRDFDKIARHELSAARSRLPSSVNAQTTSHRFCL